MCDDWRKKMSSIGGRKLSRVSYIEGSLLAEIRDNKWFRKLFIKFLFCENEEEAENFLKENPDFVNRWLAYSSDERMIFEED